MGKRFTMDPLGIYDKVVYSQLSSAAQGAAAKNTAAAQAAQLQGMEVDNAAKRAFRKKAHKRRGRLKKLWGDRFEPIIAALSPVLGIDPDDDKQWDQVVREIKRRARKENQTVEAIANQIIAERTPTPTPAGVMGQGGMMPFVLLGGVIVIGGALWMSQTK